MAESLQQLLVTNFGLSPSGYTGSQGEVGYVGSAGTNGYTGSAGASGTGILISNIQVTDSGYTALDDTAVDVAGGYIKITGSGFASGCSVLINQTAATSVTFISSTEVRAQVPATAAGTYIVYVVNTSGDVAIRVNGVTFSATPTWVTGSGLSGQSSEAISIQLSASSATTYALQAGSTLPAGLTLSNVGLISGTVSGLSASTVYNFTVVATDTELQDSPRSFALTITVGDAYFKYTTLLIPGGSTTFLADAGTNNFVLTTAGNPKPNLRSPFAGTGGSTEFAAGDKVTTPVSADFAVGSSDAFCLEFWVYYTSAPSGYTFLCSIDGTTNSQYLNIRTGDAGFSSKIQAELGSGFSGLLDNGSYTTSYLVNKWTHIAFCRTGGVVSFFIDGTRVATRSGDTIALSGNTYFGVNSVYGSQYSFPGYMSNVRWVKGSAVYNPGASTITVPTAPLTAVANTKLLILQNSQPVSNNLFLDSSTNNFAVTRNGNLPQGTFSPYGANWSTRFVRTTPADFVQVPANVGLNLTGDFTLECWINLSSMPTTNVFPTAYWITGTGPAAGDIGLDWYIGSTTMNFNLAQYTLPDISVTHNMVVGVWYHVALSRTGSSLSAYINGVQVATATTSSSSNTGYNWAIGRAEANNGETGGGFDGYISNFRVIKGTGIYPSAFTPPTTPLTAITNTSLLTCQSNRFIDTSTNAFALIPYGSPTIQRYSPFSPTAAYSAGTVGGSGYFDGTGDYLSIPTATPLVLSGSVWTMECWVYPTFALSTSPYQVVICKRVGASAASYDFYFNLNSGYLSFYNGTGYNSSALPTINAWNHIAAVYDGTNINLYMNGVRVLQTATTNPDNGGNLYIGADENGTSNFFTGYISNVRILKGTALYSGTTYTVPTEPLTAVANTSLLLTFTNAGIVDNTMQNNLETVGDAKISTTQSKFGGGSMLFDGTGDGLLVQSSSNLSMGNGNFTIEFWYYPTTTAGTNPAIMCNSNGAPAFVSGLWALHAPHSAHANKYSLWVASYASNQALLVSSNNIATNTWSFITITRSGNTWRMFVNGAIEATATHTGVLDNGGVYPLYIGYQPNAEAGRYITGYIDDLRITRGVARYTADFTPTTTAFLAQ